MQISVVQRQIDSAGTDRPYTDAALAEHLLRRGMIRASPLRAALLSARAQGATLARVLRAEDLLAEGEIAAAMAEVSGLRLVDPVIQSPDPRLIARLGAARCLSLELLPLRRIGGSVLLAQTHPGDWLHHRAEVEAAFGPVTPCLMSEAAMRQAITRHCADDLRDRAETRVAAAFSTRTWLGSASHRVLCLAVLVMAVLAVVAPLALFGVVLVWLILALGATTLLRGAALALALLAPRAGRGPPPRVRLGRLPVISVLVPLYGEPDIAPRLLRRLGRLDYPRARLDVIIVLEAKDRETRAALETCRLPGWMRVVVVPNGSVTTKPRAMNYALDFCRGSLIGIYDAEDAPDADQLIRVARHFAAAPPEVACVQGRLDYYNPHTNPIARLFTAEYASWFRVVMPLLQYLRLPMPLGGTSLFVKRAALEEIGAWDAHNVTEDADLGVRLARHGYRTEMLASTTHEEANCHLRPWLRQRSRWIKGHLLTWAVHMRAPRVLLRDLGWRGFLGYQIVFLGAQSQVLLAPVMWSFWLVLAGLPHPVQTLLPPGGVLALLLLFLLGEGLVAATAVVGLSRTRHRGLIPWVPLLPLYHPMAAVAGWRALWEAFRNPFYWAKTSHGQYDQAGAAEAPAPRPPADPLQAGAWTSGDPASQAETGGTDFRGEASGRSDGPFRSETGTRTAPATHPDAEARIARTLGQPPPLARPLTPAQRVRTSPASIFSRVSNAPEI